MTKHYQNFRLDAQLDADLLAMAKHVGKPGNRTAGLYAMAEEWRRLKAADEARLEWHRLKAEGINELSRAAQIARHEDRLAAMERRADAEGR